MRARRATAAVTAVSLAGLLGCFSDRTPTVTESTDLCDGTTRPNVVIIRDFVFEPATLHVAPGTEVTWVNCGPTPHTATSNTAVWNSGLLSTNATFKRTFASAGNFPYFCEPHPFMVASIAVP